MEGTRISPHAGLSGLIDYYIYVEIDFCAYEDGRRYCNYLPNQKQVMMIDLGDVASLKKNEERDFSQRNAMVIPGPHLKSFSIKFNPGYHRTICVCFKPSGLYRLLGIPMSKLINEDYSGEELMGPVANELCERLNNIADQGLLVRTLNEYFLSFMPGVKPVKPIDLLIAELEEGRHGHLGISDIAAMVGLSNRQLERTFKERTGLSPKLFFRLMRFSMACRLKEHYPNKTWTEIAYQASYFDQMHFIRDFKAFTDTTPMSLLKELESTLKFQKNFEVSALAHF